MSRAVPPWSSDNPDAAIPARVRLRVLEAHGHVCALTGRPIRSGDEWHVDHIRPLSMGGLHAETNLQPVLAASHRIKTADEAGGRAKADRIRAKHLGLHPPSRRPLKSRGFPKTRGNT